MSASPRSLPPILHFPLSPELWPASSVRASAEVEAVDPDDEDGGCGGGGRREWSGGDGMDGEVVGFLILWIVK